MAADVMAKLNAATRRYPKIETGMHPGEFLNEKQLEFIDFLLTPNHGTQAEWAAANDVHSRTLSAWKSERFFREEWDRRAKKINGGIERVQQVIDALFQQALNGDVKAMSLYLQYVDRYTPTQKVVEEDRSVKDMSDEELAAALGTTASNLLTRTA